MARARLAGTVQRWDATAGAFVAVSGASIRVYQLGTTTNITETMYASDSGATTLSNPLTTDSVGRYEAFRSPAGPVTLRISGTGIATYDATDAFVSDESDDEVSVQDYGAVPDAVKLASSASTTRNSTIVTVSGAGFTSDDVGKLISVVDLTAPSFHTAASITTGTKILTTSTAAFSTSDIGKTVEVQNANGSSAIWRSTIASFTSSTSVTLADNAPLTVVAKRAAWWVAPFTSTITAVLSSTQATVSAAPTASVVSAEATWGTDNGTAIQAAINAASGAVRFTGGSDLAYLVATALTLKSDLELRTDGAVILRHAAMVDALFTVPASASNVTARSLTVDCQHVSNVAAFYMTAPTTNVVLDRCEFRDCGNGMIAWWHSGTTKHTLPSLTHCQFNRRLPNQGANGLSEDLASVNISDASYVTVDGNTFAGINTVFIAAVTAAACTSSSPMQHVVVKDNQFEDCKSTTLYVSSDTSTYAHHWAATGNHFARCGVALEKGAMFGLTVGTFDSLTFSDNWIRGGGYNGSSSGYADANSPSLIQVASTSTTVTNVTIADNVVDGRPDNGSTPAAGSFQIGIRASGDIDGCRILRNKVEYVMWYGIQAYGNGTGTEITGLVIDGNETRYCVLASDANNEGDGIAILNDATAPIVQNNQSSGHGPSGGALNYTAGIGIGVYNSGGDPNAATITSAIVRNNYCTDLGRARQIYGIRFARTGAVNHPTGAIIDGNTVNGNVTAGIYWDKTTDRQHVLSQNTGYNSGFGQPLVATGLTNTGTATFIIPTTFLPTTGLLVATQTDATNHAFSANFYYVFRFDDGTARQDVSTSIKTIVLNGGTPATIASTTASSGTFTVTNNHAGGGATSIIRVFFVPFNLGSS